MSKERPSNSANAWNNLREINPVHPEPALITEACDLLFTGGVVAFPAATLYGLAADAWNRAAVEKVRQLKRRPEDKPILLLIRDRSLVAELAKIVPAPAMRIMENFWPGNVTLVFTASARVPHHLVSSSGSIGLRMPAHPVARALVERFSRPITGTSANLSGGTPCLRAECLNGLLAAPPDLILDAGPLQGGVGSTVVDVTVFPPVVLREGTVRAADILAAIG